MEQDPRRHTPRTDVVLDSPLLSGALVRLGRATVKRTVDAVLAECREGRVAPEDVVAVARARLPRGAASLRPVINATGVLVHTNLGRAPLSQASVEAVQIAAGSTDVELDLATGLRGRRGAAALGALAAAVPDAEAVHVVNNGAAALALVASALAGGGREVVIARGELVEIGDGFRLPELLESVGARIREVGTTNRVHLEDYRGAVGPETAFVLKVHPSNFVLTGFTSSVSVAALRDLPVPVVADIGSGLLRPHPRLRDEPDATTTLRAGADLVTASGDKLLGGPQCGLLLGRGDLVERLRRHPLARALRVDKLTLAALEATLSGPAPPVTRSLAATPEDLAARAARVAAALGRPATAVASRAVVGGGGAPGVALPSAAVALPAHLAAPLRRGTQPVVGHVVDSRLLLDLLSVPEDRDEDLVRAVNEVLARDGH